MNLANRTIVVTGASRGLGREIASRLTRRKANVILVARSRALLAEARQEMAQAGGSIPMAIVCDVSRQEDVERMAATIGSRYDHIDVLINNAGIGIYKTVAAMTGAEMGRQFAVNMHGPFYCSKALLPLLKKSDAGYILNVGSLFGRTAFAESSIYSATKFALSGFTQGLRQEMKRHRIKVGLFLPGSMNTSFQEHQGGKVLRAPRLLTLDPVRVAGRMEAMIAKREKTVYLHRWILCLMKMKASLA